MPTPGPSQGRVIVARHPNDTTSTTTNHPQHEHTTQLDQPATSPSDANPSGASHRMPCKPTHSTLSPRLTDHPPMPRHGPQQHDHVYAGRIEPRHVEPCHVDHDTSSPATSSPTHQGRPCHVHANRKATATTTGHMRRRRGQDDGSRTTGATSTPAATLADTASTSTSAPSRVDEGDDASHVHGHVNGGDDDAGHDDAQPRRRKPRQRPRRRWGTTPSPVDGVGRVDEGDDAITSMATSTPGMKTTTQATTTPSCINGVGHVNGHIPLIVAIIM